MRNPLHERVLHGFMEEGFYRMPPRWGDRVAAGDFMNTSILCSLAFLATISTWGYGADACLEPSAEPSVAADDVSARNAAQLRPESAPRKETPASPLHDSHPLQSKAGVRSPAHDIEPREGAARIVADDLDAVGELTPPDMKPSFAPPAPGSTMSPDEFFNNACQPPFLRAVQVPKTKPELERQLGSTFRVARRGPFLLGGDLEEDAFRQLVDGVFMCCLSCLQHDYFKKPLTQTVTIYIFRDSTSYRDGLRSFFRMNPISPYGHYGHRQRYIVVNYETGPGTLVHELTHALMAVDFPEAPIWISEGIASLYEQSRVEGDSLKGEPNWRLPELQAALVAGTLTPLRNLLSMDFRAFREQRESLHYAQSRYFCKYAESKGVLRPLYMRFRDQHESDPTGVISVERAFGKSIEAIEDEWHDWIRTRRWHAPTAHQEN